MKDKINKGGFAAEDRVPYDDPVMPYIPPEIPGQRPLDGPRQACASSPTGKHEGAWIRTDVNFRCYHCGYQLWVSDMTADELEACKIEKWEGS